MPPITDLIATIALAFGAWMGVYAMLKPRWASRVVGLSQTPGNAEGASEFRATYGGLFLFSHLATLAALNGLSPEVAPVIVLPLAAGWFGAGIGRTLSILRDDGTATRQNVIWVGFEAAMGLLIGLPLLSLAGYL